MIWRALVSLEMLAALLGAALLAALPPRDVAAQATAFNATMVQTATVSIPSASILTAKTTPVAVLPAPATGLAYLVLGATVTLNYKSATYSSTACGLYYHGGTQDALSAVFNTTVDAAASAAATLAGPSAGAIPLATVASVGLDFACTTADPSTGDSPIKIDLAYVLLPL